jgi:hypothetical protein
MLQMNDRKKQENTQMTDVGREYTAFVQQSEVAKDLLREAQYSFDQKKAKQAADLLKDTISRLASVPGFLNPRASVDRVSGQVDEVEVLCFESLTKMRLTGEILVLCLFRDGLFWVPVHSNDYLFSKRTPLADSDIFVEIDNLNEILYFRTQELSGQPVQVSAQ